LSAWLLAGTLASAQPAAPNAATPAGGETVEEAKPDLYYLKDKDGKLEPVLGFTLEDFERLLTQGARRELTPSRPAYRIDRVDVRGRATGQRAELTVEYSVVIDDDAWVRVPLRLTEAVVHGKPSYNGPGKFFLEFDATHNEYVGWVQGKSADPHRITLPVLVPLTTVTGDTRMKLSVPRAWTSDLDFLVPIKAAVAQVSPPALLDSTTAESDGTRFHVLGMSSDFTLSWRQAEGRALETPTVLEGTGELLIQLDGRSVHTQAQLTVKSFGGAFDSFRVRLPRGAVLLSGEQPDYSVSLVDTDSDATQKPAASKGAEPERSRAPIVEVRLNNPTVGPVSVKLATAQTFPAGAADDQTDRAAPPQRAATDATEAIELAGFEIVGAVRQWGHVAVQVVGQWQVVWGQRRQVRQVEDVPADLWRDDMLAGFEYFMQPFSLQARVMPRETRIHIDPQYVALVGDTRVDLEARLRYQISGAKAFELEIDLAGWQLDDVGPPSAVDVDEVGPLEGTMLSVPLVRPALGTFELTLRAHRPIDPDGGRVEFGLPKPSANSIGPATLVVQPADNVQLSPRPADLRGLSAQSSKPNVVLPVRQQLPLAYVAENPDATFGAGFRVFRRTITVAQRGSVSLETKRVRVQQRFNYEIAHEPIEVLSLRVPSGILDDGDLGIMQGSRSLPWGVVEEEVADTAGLPLVHVALPEPAIGPLELVAEFDLEEELPAPRSTVSLTVPLIAATDALTSSELTVSCAPELRVQLLDSQWQPTETVRRAGDPIELTATTARSQLSLGLRLREVHDVGTTMVDRAWVQSWLGERSRQDRSAYQVTTPDSHFTMRLPNGISALEVLVDGVRVVPEEGSSLDQLIVPLVQGPHLPGTFAIEVRYRFAERKWRPMQGTLTLQSPVLERDLVPRRTFWQVILPADEHLWTAPENFTAENIWSWTGLLWDYAPAMGQAELESWVGTRHDTPLPATVHPYLFCTTDDESTLELRVVRRSLLVFEASGLVLLVGLATVYWPLARHPAALLLAALAVVPLGFIYPQPALLLAEAAGLGLCLSVLAMVLKRNVAVRSSAGRPLRSGPSSIVSRGSSRTQPHFQGAVAGSMATTSTAELSVPISEPEAPR
jgi:hypothetical protein